MGEGEQLEGRETASLTLEPSFVVDLDAEVEVEAGEKGASA